MYLAVSIAIVIQALLGAQPSESFQLGEEINKHFELSQSPSPLQFKDALSKYMVAFREKEAIMRGGLIYSLSEIVEPARLEHKTNAYLQSLRRKLIQDFCTGGLMMKRIVERFTHFDVPCCAPTFRTVNPLNLGSCEDAYNVLVANCKEYVLMHTNLDYWNKRLAAYYQSSGRENITSTSTRFEHGKEIFPFLQLSIQD